MKRADRGTPREETVKPNPEYEAPRIETKITAAEMEREVQYAGRVS